MKPTIYLNTASAGLLDEQTLHATNTLYQQMLTQTSTAVEHLRDHGLQRIRETVGKFIHAPAANIALIPNFSYALNAIVHALDGNERVMLYRNDYPSVYEPFRINGFDIKWIEHGDDGFTMNIAAMKALLLANNIDILAISHVQWMSGYTLDLKDIGEFCAANNIRFIVDATQSLGALPVYIDELKVDVLIASNYKWMNAGFGHGIMYMSDDFLKRYTPVVGGNASYGMYAGQWKYEPSIRSYEPGHLNFHGLLIAEAAINQKLEKGIEQIVAHNLRLTAQLVEGIGKLKFSLLGPATMDNRCSIVLLKAGEDLQKHLQQHNIIVIHRNGFVRISIHQHNTEADIAAILAALATFNPQSNI
jgi:selenocysteine lyase/cysteine desulfurase